MSQAISENDSSHTYKASCLYMPAPLFGNTYLYRLNENPATLAETLLVLVKPWICWIT